MSTNFNIFFKKIDYEKDLSNNRVLVDIEQLYEPKDIFKDKKAMKVDFLKKAVMKHVIELIVKEFDKNKILLPGYTSGGHTGSKETASLFSKLRKENLWKSKTATLKKFIVNAFLPEPTDLRSMKFLSLQAFIEPETESGKGSVILIITPCF